MVRAATALKGRGCARVRAADEGRAAHSVRSAAEAGGCVTQHARCSLASERVLRLPYESALRVRSVPL
jgi:hypothetical protein